MKTPAAMASGTMPPRTLPAIIPTGRAWVLAPAVAVLPTVEDGVPIDAEDAHVGVGPFGVIAVPPTEEDVDVTPVPLGINAVPAGENGAALDGVPP
jgi:hypothetical protein